MAEKIYSVEELPLHKFFNILDSNKYLILLITLTITGIVVFFSPSPISEYEANATVMVKNKSVSPLSFQSQNSTGMMPFFGIKNNMTTYIELIRSKVISEAAAKILLAESIKESPVLGPGKNIYDSLDTLTDYIQDSIDADFAKQANLLKISAKTDDDELSVKLANLVATVFMNFNRTLERGEIKSALNYIIEQKGIYNKKLSDAEEKLRLYLQKTSDKEYINRDDKQVLSLITKLDIEIQNIELNKELLRRKFKYLSQNLNLKVPENPDKSVLQSLSKEMIDLKYKLKTLNNKYEELSVFQKPSHPELKEVLKQIQNLKNKIVELETKADTTNTQPFSFIYNIKEPFTVGEKVLNDLFNYENDIKMFEIKKQDLLKRRTDYLEKLKVLPLHILEHSRLLKEVEIAQNVLQRLIQREEELRIIEAKELGGLILIDRAKKSKLTNPPKPKSTITILSFFLGLIIAVCTALIKEYLETTFKSPNDVIKILKKQILGIIPEITSSDVTKEKIVVRNFSKFLISHYAPKSPVSESFRTLRSVLDVLTTVPSQEGVERQGKSIMITSSVPNEGKSIIAANIAISLAKINKKVILVDSDTRKPTINTFFNMNSSPGLLDVVFKNFGLENVIMKSGVPNLDLLKAGARVGSQIEFTTSKNFKKILNKLYKSYDYVIFDTPALLVVSDPIMMSPMMDSVILVVKQNVTKYDFALKALRYLENVRANVVGVIYNGAKIEKSYYYKYYEKEH